MYVWLWFLIDLKAYSSGKPYANTKPTKTMMKVCLPSPPEKGMRPRHLPLSNPNTGFQGACALPPPPSSLKSPTKKTQQSPEDVPGRNFIPHIFINLYLQQYLNPILLYMCQKCFDPCATSTNFHSDMIHKTSYCPLHLPSCFCEMLNFVSSLSLRKEFLHCSLYFLGGWKSLWHPFLGRCDCLDSTEAQLHEGEPQTSKSLLLVKWDGVQLWYLKGEKW